MTRLFQHGTSFCPYTIINKKPSPQSGGKNRASPCLIAASKCVPKLRLFVPNANFLFFSLYSDEDEALWEPYSAEVLAEENYELTESDWEQIKEERRYNSRDEERQWGEERPEDAERDEEGEICPQKVRLT